MPVLTHGPLVGATTDTTATIWLRADTDCTVEIRLGISPADSADQLTAAAVIDKEADYTAVLNFTGLQPDTLYYYTVLLDDHPALDDNFAGHTFFRTFPAPEVEAGSFSFAFGSCFIPELHEDKIFNNLIRAADQADPRFFLMIGDNVYVDKYVELRNNEQGNPPAESLLALYRAAYRNSWAALTFRRALAQTPSCMIFDDHEFWDNWNNSALHLLDREGSLAAKQAYLEYQDSHNPACETRHKTAEPTYYYDFSYGKDIGFFVLDCRTRRNPQAIPYPTILGDEQRQTLYKWLRDNKTTYRLKFIVSSVPVSFIALPHWLVKVLHHTLGDQWLGYPEERLELFKFIQHEQIEGVHFLSGDIHLGQGLVIEAAKDKPGPTVYSYTSSPLANNFHLLPEQTPAWFSTLLWLLVGLSVGIIAAWRTGITYFWGLVGGFAGGLLAAWLWRKYKALHDNKSKTAMGSGEKGLYTILHRIAHIGYLRRNMGVAADTITGGSVHYVPDNLFPAVHNYNMGIVTVDRRPDDNLAVQFKLTGIDGNTLGCEEEAHAV